MTISRWLKNQERKIYTTNRILKSNLIVETLRAIIKNNPIVSLYTMTEIVKKTLNFSVSKELVRSIIKKLGFTKKKARFFGVPKKLQEKTEEFLTKRDHFLKDNRLVVSLDETSFGRNCKNVIGYSQKGVQLRMPLSKCRVTTVSSLTVVSSTEIIQHEEINGSYNTKKFELFLENLSLPKHTVILLDNVSFHRSASVRPLCRKKDFELLFVPPYSPWYNPIEGVFSIIKRHYYKTRDIQGSFHVVTKEHCQAFFRQSYNWKTI
jgi:transposase